VPPGIPAPFPSPIYALVDHMDGVRNVYKILEKKILSTDLTGAGVDGV
jgi:hypothetical protein